MSGLGFGKDPMLALYEVLNLLTRAQALLDQSDETLLAAQLSSVLDMVQNRLGSGGERPH